MVVEETGDNAGACVGEAVLFSKNRVGEEGNGAREGNDDAGAVVVVMPPCNIRRTSQRLFVEDASFPHTVFMDEGATSITKTSRGRNFPLRRHREAVRFRLKQLGNGNRTSGLHSIPPDMRMGFR